MLEDFMQFSIEPFRDNPDEDMQIEEIHFQYDTSQMKPRIFNDMITLKSSNHMVKLTLSHGLSQSAVVARYEDIMDKTIEVDWKLYLFIPVLTLYLGYKTFTKRDGRDGSIGKDTYRDHKDQWSIIQLENEC